MINLFHDFFCQISWRILAIWIYCVGWDEDQFRETSRSLARQCWISRCLRRYIKLNCRNFNCQGRRKICRWRFEISKRRATIMCDFFTQEKTFANLLPPWWQVESEKGMVESNSYLIILRPVWSPYHNFLPNDKFETRQKTLELSLDTKSTWLKKLS